MNHLLSVKGPSCLAPWLCGAPFTVLLKKGGGVHLIAVGEVLCQLASRHCCLIICPSLPDTFLLYGQLYSCRSRMLLIVFYLFMVPMIP